MVDFEVFRPALEKALAYGSGAKGGRPPYDPVAMFKVLILAAQNTVSDARMEFLIRDRLSWLRFLGFDLGAPTPDENTIRLFREKLTRAARSARCSSPSTGSCASVAICRWEARSSTPRWWPRRSSATLRPIRRRSRRARAPARYGRISQPGRRRRTPTRDGR